MLVSLGLLKSLTRCLCWILSIFLVIESIQKHSDVSFHSVLYVEEVKIFIILKLLKCG